MMGCLVTSQPPFIFLKPICPFRSHETTMESEKFETQTEQQPWTQLPVIFLKGFETNSSFQISANNVETEKSQTQIEQPPWTELPIDVTANILQRLGAIDILKNVRRVCTTWWNLCKDPSMWRIGEVKNSAKLGEMPNEILSACLSAVDCSQGQLIDLSVEYFCSEVLLSYISARCNKLRRLRIASANGLSKELAEAVATFPELEELDILLVSSSIPNRYTWAPDRRCTNLSWFTFNEFGDRFNLEENNNYALAVARNKPCLRRLRNFQNETTTKELRVILAGCPRLESFSLRLCSNVDLEE